MDSLIGSFAGSFKHHRTSRVEVLITLFRKYRVSGSFLGSFVVSWTVSLAVLLAVSLAVSLTVTLTVSLAVSPAVSLAVLLTVSSFHKPTKGQDLKNDNSRALGIVLWRWLGKRKEDESTRLLSLLLCDTHKERGRRRRSRAKVKRRRHS
jgi:hypothetical protein